MKCEYCNQGKLNLLIESKRIWNVMYLFAEKRKPLEKEDIQEEDYSLVLEIRNNQGYLRMGDRSEMQCIDHSEILKINFCPICGRNLTNEQA